MQKQSLQPLASYLLTQLNHVVTYGGIINDKILSKERSFLWEMYCKSCKIYTEEDAFNQLQ